MTSTHNLGFPRIGADRELKKSLEAYWRGDINQTQLLEAGQALRQKHWQWQADAGIDLIPTGDFAWYDQVLTLSATLGNIPQRHRSGNTIDLDTLFRTARGRAPTGCACEAADMTKWFDTNYHYLVPEFTEGQTFSLCWTQIIDETREAVALGHKVKPVILGPLSYLWLGKTQGNNFDKLTLLEKILPAYGQLLAQLAEAGAEWIQIDEPILTLDLPSAWQQAFERAYNQLQNGKFKILLATYFGELGNNLSFTLNLPVAGIHIDAVRAPAQVTTVIDRLSAHKILSIGIVDGRNIWRNDLEKSCALLRQAQETLGERLWLAPSCSLLHVPVDLDNEKNLDEELTSWLAFARQKLNEVCDIKNLLEAPTSASAQSALQTSNHAVKSRSQSSRIHNPQVAQRLANIKASDSRRDSPFTERIVAQQKHLQLPLLPTTTIGSFPQTTDIRSLRRRFKTGDIGESEYQIAIRAHIQDAISRQEALDIDVLVHGEAERNDMVEYFGEQLSGFAFTQNGWVQSYGSRCVKPPIIYGDITRPKPMTLDWISYAQSLTQRPVKGMLTGPITILCWSFVRDDQSRETTAKQIALAIRDEVLDLENAGTKIIQIDEPAIREGLPLRKKDWKAYLNWAVEAFKLSSCGVQDTTQIHTHMCYSEFNDIIAAIAQLDADVITIETSRSQGELLQAFEDFKYPNHIGPGVYDIHSPNVPKSESMAAIIHRAAKRLPLEHLWINPDCGLKTRAWPETEAALKKMVQTAKALRAVHGEIKAAS